MNKSLKCNNCGYSVAVNHIMEDDRITKMSNGDKIIAPRCGNCLKRLTADAVWYSKDKEQRVILVTGLCGSGKSSIGKMIEQKLGYVHIDGDAVSKRINWDIRNGFLEKRSGYRVYDELLDTIQIVLQLGYSVIATYVFSEEILNYYVAKLTENGVKVNVFVLKTDKNVCIERDKLRECWTAGEEFIMEWYNEQNRLTENGRWNIIDNSYESLIETVDKILVKI